MPCGEHGVSYFVQMYSHLSFINNICVGNFNTEKYWFRVVCETKATHLWGVADFGAGNGNFMSISMSWVCGANSIHGMKLDFWFLRRFLLFRCFGETFCLVITMKFGKWCKLLPAIIQDFSLSLCPASDFLQS